MTALEIILIVILWIGYGCFAAYQTSESVGIYDTIPERYFWNIILAPVIFILKCIYGAFKKYE